MIFLAYARPLLAQTSRRAFSTNTIRRDASRTPTSLTNILADGIPPPVQVSSITPSGILLADGLILPSACIFLNGKVFLWDVPEKLWAGWTKDHFEIFEAVVPKPGQFYRLYLANGRPHIFYMYVELLLLGTGATMALPPPHLRKYMSDIGIQMDFMDTVRRVHVCPFIACVD